MNFLTNFMLPASTKIALLFTLILVNYNIAFASSQSLNKFSLKNIPQIEFAGTILAIEQDHHGFIWIGGESGLLRYDGHESITYQVGAVYDIHLDRDNQLWVIAGAALKRLDSPSNTFSSVVDVSKGFAEPSAFHPVSLFEISPNEFLIGHRKGVISHYRADQTTIAQYELKDPVMKTDFAPYDLPITQDNTGKIYAGYHGSLYYFTGHSFEKLQDDVLTDANFKVIRELAPKNDSTIAIASNAGTFIYQHETSLMQLDSTPSRSVKYMDDQLFIGTKYGIQIKENETLVLEQRTVSVEDSDIKLGRVVDILKDKQSNVWAVSWGGIYLQNNSQTQFQLHPMALEDIVLPSAIVHDTIIDQQNNLWIATPGYGVLRKQLTQDKFELYANHYLAVGNNPSRNIYALYEDANKQIWAGSEIGLLKYNTELNQFDLIALRNILTNQTPSMAITHIIEDHLQHFWVVTTSHILYIDPKSKDILHSIEGGFESISLTNDNQILISGNGAYIANAQGRFEQIFSKTIPDTETPFAVLNTIQDQHGNYWLASANGLYVAADENFVFEKFDVNGQANDLQVYNVINNKDGTIWLSDNKSFFQLEPATKHIKNVVNLKKGVSDIILWNSLSEDNNGTIYLGSSSGVASFAAKARVQPIKTVITKVTVDEQTFIPYHQNNETVSIQNPTIAHATDHLSFNFNAIDFSKAPYLNYRYQLVGYDKHWQTSPANVSLATYTNLPHGDYQFIVQSKVPYSDWSEARFHFTIATPWYFTWWAYLAYVLLVCIALTMIVKWRTKQLNAQNQALQLAVDERTREINTLLTNKNNLYANISHEFRTPLTIMLLPISKMLNSSNAKDSTIWQAAYLQGQRLTKMVEHLIRIAKHDDINHNDQKVYALQTSIEQLVASFSSAADEKSIEFTCSISLDKHLNVYLVEDSLEQILGNLISNAIKYTPTHGRVMVNVAQQAEQIKLSVADNGIGIKLDDQAKIFERFSRIYSTETEYVDSVGIGLAIVYEMVKLNSGEISLESSVKQGATFNVSLPLIVAPDTATAMNESAVEREIQNAKTTLPTVAQQEEDIIQSSKNKARVLIIEDNPDLSTILLDSLAEHFHCIHAADGEKGIKLAEKEVPELILSDLMMPKKDGYQVCQHIKESQITAHIPVVLLTAKGEKSSVIKGWQYQADEYISKPFDMDNLISRLHNIIQARHQLRSLYRQQLLSQANVPATEDKLSNTETLSPAEQFTEKLSGILQANYQEASFSVKQLSALMHMSERQLQRKMQTMVNLSPKEYLRIYRLTQSKKLLAQQKQATEVAYDVGFNSPAYFGACFKKAFGMTPSQFQKAATEKNSTQ